MLVPESNSLSPTDIKILQALTRELTALDVSTVSGVPYEYCKKRIGLLKKKHFVKERPVGTQVYYHTVRLVETEDIYRLAETRSSENIEYEFVFYGEFGNFNKHLNTVDSERGKLKEVDTSLTRMVYRLICALKVRSHRKSNGQSAQYPDEDKMREWLLKRIVVARKELTLAEELYNARGLWSGDARVWQQISTGEPTEAVVKAYNDVGKIVK